MSAETSTKRAKQAPPADDAIPGFQAWHLFVIGTLLASAAAAIAVRGTRPANVVFVCLTVLAAGVAGYAVYRTLWPLAHPDAADSPEMLGGRTRAALEREKALLLRAIKELEFDRAMGKVSEADCAGDDRPPARPGDSADPAARRRRRRLPRADRQGTGRAPRRGRRRLMLVAVALGGLLTAHRRAARRWAGRAAWPACRTPGRCPASRGRTARTAPGTISVRLVRGQLANLVDGPSGRVHRQRHVADREDRRRAAEPCCRASRPGATVHVLATVDGERLDSQDFQAPPDAGVLLLLVAIDTQGASETTGRGPWPAP